MLGALSGGLGVPAVTTNYDPLYEDAVTSTGARILRIPWDQEEAQNDETGMLPQLLKLHGCVTDPPSIVLSRADYMR